MLVFEGIKVFDFSVTMMDKDEGGKIILRDPLISHYRGSAEGTIKYVLEGSLHGFPSSVDITIEAQRFALHILEKDEPTRQS